MKAPFILRQNISTLLAARKETATALARYCGNHKTWASQFLTGKRDEIQLSDIDKIADFFGVANYQLFQPGISSLTERRNRNDRRTGQERRVGHKFRELGSLRAELNKVPSFSSSHHEAVAVRSPAAVPEPVKAILADAERRIAAYYAAEARGQTSSTRPPRTSVPKRR